MNGAVHHKAITGALPAHGTVAGGILKTLAYFDVFQYPLAKKEIRQFMDHIVNEACFERTLHGLLEEGFVFIHHGFYSLHNNPLLACKRIQGNRKANALLPKAQKIGRFLYRFPFVRGIGISGSLSKNFADEKADIDFFIITRANRLWIARTMMHFFKKITYLFGRQHYYCMNYYVDEQALLLEEHNIFTAMEMKTLLPVSGSEAIATFFMVNQWAGHWLPACASRKQERKDPPLPLFKKVAEWLFSNRLGDCIDSWLMHITGRRWKQKEREGRRNKKGLAMGLITGKHFARSNPGNLQEKILGLYEEKLRGLKIENLTKTENTK